MTEIPRFRQMFQLSLNMQANLQDSYPTLRLIKVGL